MYRDTALAEMLSAQPNPLSAAGIFSIFSSLGCPDVDGSKELQLRYHALTFLKY